MTLAFSKWVGAGNDFVFLSHHEDLQKKGYPELARQLCDRHFGVGADGMAAIEVLDLDRRHFKWHFFNNDGSSAEMCGNAARCAVRYIAQMYGPGPIELETLSGLIQGTENGDRVETSWELAQPLPIKKSVELSHNQILEGFFINTGVPHFVLVNPPDTLSLSDYLEIQKHPTFGADQTNVTPLFIKDDVFHTKSFERGVKNFTLACGTGVIAAARVLKELQEKPEYDLITPGGEMSVQFRDQYVKLVGPAQLVFQGEYSKERID